MRLVFLLGSILWAGTAPMPKAVWRYFLAQFLYTICLAFVSYGSTLYDVSYSILTGIILATIVGICLWSLKKHRIIWLHITIGLGIGFFLGWVAYQGLTKPLHLYDWIGISEGFILSGSGVIVGFAIPYLSGRDRMLAKTFSTLWLFQAAYRFGYPFHAYSDLWLRMNWVVPTVLCVSAFTWIGWRLRSSVKMKASAIPRMN